MSAYFYVETPDDPEGYTAPKSALHIYLSEWLEQAQPGDTLEVVALNIGDEDYEALEAYE